MRESRTYGSVRGDRGNPVPYRDTALGLCKYEVRSLYKYEKEIAWEFQRKAANPSNLIPATR